MIMCVTLLIKNFVCQRKLEAYEDREVDQACMCVIDIKAYSEKDYNKYIKLNIKTYKVEYNTYQHNTTITMRTMSLNIAYIISSDVL